MNKFEFEAEVLWQPGTVVCEYESSEVIRVKFEFLNKEMRWPHRELDLTDMMDAMPGFKEKVQAELSNHLDRK